MKKYVFITLVLIVALFFSCKTNDTGTDDKGIKVMAYFYPSRGSKDPGTLPLDKLTHIIYSFTEVIDNEMKFKDDSSEIKLKMLVKERWKHPHLKVMIACGGWGGSGGFSEMARSPENRKKFMDSVVDFIKRNKLDGLDIDWEYPGMPGAGNPYIPEDKENFTALMCELREAMDEPGKVFLPGITDYIR